MGPETKEMKNYKPGLKIQHICGPLTFLWYKIIFKVASGKGKVLNLYICHNILPWMSKKSSAITAGPLSMAFPDPLNTRPKKQH